MTSEEKRWREQANFMRDVGAIRADFAESGELTHLELLPIPVARPAPPQGVGSFEDAKAAHHAARGGGPAASLARMHETMFAHTRMRPRLPEPAPSSDVPRAVSVKKAAARGSKKAQKRNAR